MLVLLLIFKGSVKKLGWEWVVHLLGFLNSVELVRFHRGYSST